MSSRVKTRALNTASVAVSVLFGSVLLTGCSSFSGLPTTKLNPDELVTGSINPADQGNLNQAMPGVLQPAQNSVSSNGRYLPPANVGGSAMPQIIAPMTTASVSSVQLLPPIQNSATIVPSQTLPVPLQSSSVGSQQIMPVQSPSVAIAPARVTEPFQDNATPQVAPSRITPSLSVVQNTAPAQVAQASYKHTIESGESLYAIARRYDVSANAIVQANGLDAPDQIFVGQKLIIPGRSDLLAANATPAPTDPVTTATIAPPAPATQSQAASSAPVTPAPVVTTPTVSAAPVNVASASPTISNAADFRWPVTGRVITRFEESSRTGINIEAPSGAAVRAAENGTVIYVGSGVSGFGNLVLVRHSNGYVSAYAHMKDITVAKDASVSRGDQIGTVGMSGSVTRPQLHFELRQGATPVDPMPLLAS